METEAPQQVEVRVPTLEGRTTVRSTVFAPPGGDREVVIVTVGDPELEFEDQLAQVVLEYELAVDELGLDAETVVHRRIYLSDAVNRRPAVDASPLGGGHGSAVAVSVIDQAPLPAKLALVAYHAEGNDAKTLLTGGHVLVERHGFAHLWTTALRGRPRTPPCAAAETGEAFATLRSVLEAHGGTIAAHTVRTWIYVTEIDTFYASMNAGRTSSLAHAGLTASTHFLASTGIGGGSGDPSTVVTVDALSIVGLEESQVTYPNDFSRLCKTSDYGVTFERATRIAWADRAHVYLSGTASIDATGQIVHPGDVLAQLDHALGNASALLAAGGATLRDLLYLVCYVRDAADCERVRTRLAASMPTVPQVVVAADVCRPGWLVEIEGVAATHVDDPAKPSF